MLAPLWAQVPNDSVSTWVPAGSAGVAVGGLVYVAKKLASGELVSVNTAEVMQSSQRIAQQALDLGQEAHEREAALRELVVSSTSAMTANTAAVAELTRVMAVPAPTRPRAAAKKRT